MINLIRNLSRDGGKSAFMTLVALAFAGAAQAAPRPPDHVSAVADVESLLTGQVLQQSGPLTLSVASEIVHGVGSSPNGSTASGAATASADATGRLKVSISDSASTATSRRSLVHKR